MNVTFSTAIKLYFANYANFKGRSTRAEYWWAMLFVFILNIITSKIPYFSAVIGLGLIIPTLAIVPRRFHDSGRSGWWVLILLAASIVGCTIALASIFPSIINSPEDPQRVYEAITSNIGTVSLGYGIAVIAGIVSLIFTLLPSGPDNKYGPNPYGPGSEEVAE